MRQFRQPETGNGNGDTSLHVLALAKSAYLLTPGLYILEFHNTGVQLLLPDHDSQWNIISLALLDLVQEFRVGLRNALRSYGHELLSAHNTTL